MRRAAPLALAWLCGTLAPGAAAQPGQAPGGAARSSSAPGRPNVILILTDDQGYGDVGAHGNRTIHTPSLDRLAGESVRLTDFHVDPTCSPTRAALLTGRYSTRTGVWHTIMGRSLMAPRERTVAELFSASGYRTGMFGKWHLGDNYPLRPHDRGFAEAFYHGGGVVGQVGDFFGNDLYDDNYFRNGVPQPVKGYATDVWFDEALKFVERNRDQPFFLYLAPNAAHWPYYVDQQYVRPYTEAGVPPTMARFYGMIASIDENVGRLRARLRERGLEENTILIFTTDNGSAEGFANWRNEPGSWAGWNAGMRDGKSSAYDGGHRVPFYLRWPKGGLAGGREVSTLSAHIDVLPTLAELCDVEIPQDLRLDGTSLVPALRATGPQAAESSHALSERVLFVHSQRVDVPVKWRQSSVMTKRWRLIDGAELFDMAADPGQKTDVAARNAEVVEELRRAYDVWWTSLEPAFSETVRIGIGSPAESPTALSSHDWRAPDDAQVVWNARQVHSLHPGNGYWAIDVVRGGRYEVELRRWPRPSLMGLEASHARLALGGVEQAQAISPYDDSASFHVELTPGPTTIQTWLTTADGKTRGAYFVYVRRLD